MKLKQASYKNGRGYSGWHRGYFNQNVYCRSLLEKIYCLILDEQMVYYETEKQTFVINGYNYKPDFFIYDFETKSLKMIREIKGTNGERNEYLKNFGLFFKKCGIDYDVIVIDKRKKYYKKWKDELEYYKSNSDSYIQSGELNPMYGLHHTDITKEKLRQKTGNRWKDDIEKQKMMDGIINASKNPNTRKKISDGKKRYHRKEKRKRLMLDIAEKGGYIKKNCYICGSVFMDRVYNNRYHCFSYSCVQKNSPKNNFKKKWDDIEKEERFKTTLIKTTLKYFDINELDINTFNQLRKERLYNKSPVSLNSINKYFGNFENFKRRVKEWQKSNE